MTAFLRFSIDARLARLGLTIMTVLAACVLSACSEGDTVLALNVTIRSSAGAARQLAVTVSQTGQPDVVATLSVPTMPTDAGPVATSGAIVERIVLPSSYVDGEGSVRVSAVDAAGAEVASAVNMFAVRQNGAVAAFVTLGPEPEPMQGDESSDDQDAGSVEQ